MNKERKKELEKRQFLAVKLKGLKDEERWGEKALDYRELVKFANYTNQNTK
jgi:hypothetical protein